METVANIFVFIAGELLCIAGVLVAGRMGYQAVANLTWDSFYSKQQGGALDHYIMNGVLAIFAIVLTTTCIAFAIIIPYILWGAA